MSAGQGAGVQPKASADALVSAALEALEVQPRLSPATLQRVASVVHRPAFDRRSLRSGIVHLGLGAFMRGHLAAATDAAQEAAFDPAWGITGVSLRSPATRDALAPQQGLYTLALRDANGQSLRVIGSLIECLVAPDDPAAVLARIAAPEARILSLTITEKGYCRDLANGGLMWDHADIAHDLAHPQAPRSAIGYIVRGLALRRAVPGAQGGLTLMSLDNLPSNGHTLRALVLVFAERVDPALANWIDAHCSFPNSMVDRIVPRTTPADVAAISAALGAHDAWPVLGEPFFDWAVEDDFVAGRPDWSVAGARFVDDAAPWERLKLRMVNGAHSSIAYLGLLAGWATVDEAMAQPALHDFIQALLRDEIEPTLVDLPGLDLAAYRARLLQRFANPALAHRTAQIAMDGSQKLPLRLLSTLRDRLRANAPVERIALAIAAWWLHLGGLDERGHSIAVDDPLASALQTWHAQAQALATDAERAAHITRFAAIFGDVAESPALVAALAQALPALRHCGVVRAIERLA